MSTPEDAKTEHDDSAVSAPEEEAEQSPAPANKKAGEAVEEESTEEDSAEAVGDERESEASEEDVAVKESEDDASDEADRETHDDSADPGALSEEEPAELGVEESVLEKAPPPPPEQGPPEPAREKFSLAGAWSELRELLFAPDFEIDEEPEDVRLGAGFASFGGEAARSPDVISLVSDLMRREEKARVQAKAAKAQASQGGGGEREMMRLMKQMLTMLDSFEHVIQAGREMETSEELSNWLKSVESLQARALSTLGRFGLVQLKTIGQPVNLDFQEVVEYRPSPDHKPDTVIAERQKGYVFNNRLLRDAKVVVAMPMRSQ